MAVCLAPGLPTEGIPQIGKLLLLQPLSPIIDNLVLCCMDTSSGTTFTGEMARVLPRNNSGVSNDEGLLPTGSEERGVLGVRSIPVAILPSCQNMKTMAL